MEFSAEAAAPVPRPTWREITLEEALAKAPEKAPEAARAAAEPAPFPELVGAPSDVRQRLDGLDLTIAGVGGVGAPFIDNLAALSPGTGRLVDPDSYHASNLRSQPIEPAALGKPKVEVLGRRLKARSPGTRVLVAQCRFEELEVGDLQASGAVVVAGDNLPLTAAVSQRACELGQAVFQGSIHGPTSVLHVRRTVPRAARACPCCTWDAGERRELERQTRYACDGSGRLGDNPGGPSGALSALGSLAGGQLIYEILRWVLGLDESSEADAIIEYCALSRRAVVSPLLHNNRCRIMHAAWKRVHAPRPLLELSPAQLIALAYPRSPGRTLRRSLQLEGWDWLDRAACACDQHPLVGRYMRPVPAGHLLGPCEGCRDGKRVHPFHQHRRASPDMFGDSMERSLAELGVDEVKAAIVHGGTKSTLVLGPLTEGAR